jgi:hypothetical protein
MAVAGPVCKINCECIKIGKHEFNRIRKSINEIALNKTMDVFILFKQLNYGHD